MRRRSWTTLLLLLLSFAVPALLTDLECMVGRSECHACSESAEAVGEDCSAASLAALEIPASVAPPALAPARVETLPEPVPATADVEQERRAPRDGPRLRTSGLRAPPA